MVIRVNGMAGDVVPATDRGLAYGDGVFRTLVVRGGRPLRWARHYAKLAADAARLGIACPGTEALLEDVLAVSAEQGEHVVKLIVTRGPGERGYRIPAAARPTRIVMSAPLPTYPGHDPGAGVSVRLCATRLGTQTALAGVKHLNRLENVLARSEWSGDAFAEGLMRDERGDVICGTMSNLFIVEGEALCTPHLGHCGVAGLTRELILERAAREGITCNVEAVPLERLLAADEVFLANSVIGVWPVRAVDDESLSAGGTARRVRAWLDEADAST